MSPPSLDPRHLDLVRFASAGAALSGQWPAASLDRLAIDAPPSGDGQVLWSARGESRAVAGSPPEVWLHVQANTVVQLVCQRCLQALHQPLAAQRSIRWVADEAEAERLDELCEDDVLALPSQGRLDLKDLVEDELILSLPLVPRHGVCPDPLPLPEDDLQDEPPANPFSVLAGLKVRQN
jgi:uncharacterized protein